MYKFLFFDDDGNHVDTQWFDCLSGNEDEVWSKAEAYAYRYGYSDFMLEQ